jgi:hypothetical protein
VQPTRGRRQAPFFGDNRKGLEFAYLHPLSHPIHGRMISPVAASVMPCSAACQCRRCDHRCTLRRVATASAGRAQPGIGGGPVRVPASLAGKPQHRVLQDRARTDVYLTQHHRRTGYLGPGFVSEKLVEAHRGLTVLTTSYVPGPGRCHSSGPARRVRPCPALTR